MRVPVSCYAVCFSIPLAVLKDRVRRRKGHEGKVEGARGTGVCVTIHAQLKKSGTPSRTEGFAEIIHIKFGKTYRADFESAVQQLVSKARRPRAESHQV